VRTSEKARMPHPRRIALVLALGLGLGARPEAPAAAAGLAVRVDDLPAHVEERARAFRRDFTHLQEQQLDTSVAYFQEIAEWALTLRAETIRFAREAAQLRDDGLPLDGAKLELMREGMAAHLAVRAEVRHLIEPYIPWLEPGASPFVSEATRMKGIMLGTAGALLLYDNFAFSTMYVQRDKDLRRLVNRPDSGFALGEGEMLEVLREYHSPDNRRRMRAALGLLRSSEPWIRAHSAQDAELAWLHGLITQSPSAQEIEEDSIWAPYVRSLGILSVSGRDKLDFFGKEGLDVASRLFGNTVGLVETRRGKLYGNPHALRRLEQELQPMDILLEKTPFRLTDKLIPGHFGHVAIWMGNPTQLRELGVWTDPVVRRSWRELREGEGVLEALRDGVQLNRLDAFLNVDDLVVLRFKDLTDEERRAAVVRALRQKGKAYDFNFDVETTDRIVCSELAYVTFTHTPWPTESVLQRATISPDNVAERALRDGPLEVVTFYRGGKRVRWNAEGQLAAVLEAERP
jgi:hypothetical protein